LHLYFSPAYPLTLYYDGSCRLCSGEIRHLQARDRAGRLAFVDCSPADFTGGPAPRAALMEAIHAVDAAGRVYVGVDTFRAAYAAAGLPLVSGLLGLPLVSQAARRAYPVLVRHRYRLPGWLIGPLFERAARRAARRSAGCREGICTVPGGARGGR
jgi:predicted DCC family thiol-disulfide oxidoreductase YuxK